VIQIALKVGACLIAIYGVEALTGHEMDFASFLAGIGYWIAATIVDRASDKEST
jgi:hypothetical protein